MKTAAVLPEWRHISAMFRTAGDKTVQMEQGWRRHEGDQAFWFSRGAGAIRVIVEWWRLYQGARWPIVWFPSYMCNQSLELLRNTQSVIRFYPVDSTLQPQWERCEELAQGETPDIFFLVHYFGHPSDARLAKKFCGQHGAIFVEDAAHQLQPVPGVGEFCDFIFYSQHKLLPIPDGALLLMRFFPGGFHLRDQEACLNAMHEAIKKVLPANNTKMLVWVAKRLMQRILPQGLLQRLRGNVDESFASDKPPLPIETIAAMYPGSKRMVAIDATQMSIISRRRKENEALLNYIFQQVEGAKAFSFFSATDYSPYLAVVQCCDEKRAAELYDQIRKQGAIVLTWPDLPPEVLYDPDNHAEAIRFRRTLLFFPIHQSFSTDTLIHDYAFLCTADPERSVETKSSVKFDIAECAEWRSLFADIKQSNLLQAWTYGEAKGASWPWRVRREIISYAKEPVALLQYIEVSVPLLGKLIRINRGPLWLKPVVPSVVTEAVLYALDERFRGNKLLFAPWLENSPENLWMLHRCGFVRKQSRPWCSAWIDLQKTEEELRKCLKARWRNQLSFAERAGLTVKISAGADEFNWLMDRYHELMKEKSFQGTKIDLLQKLRSAGGEGEQVVLQALLRGDPVAGILVSKHGAACTYLVGWNSSDGRKLNANNYLLWQALLHMKKEKLKWFDLGGIDDIATPSIAVFKRGMNGVETELVGEYRR